MVDVLANWGWQGCAVALASTAILRASRHMSATTRYHLWWVTLAAVLVLPVVSFQLPAASSGLPASSSQVPAPSLKQDALKAQSGDSGLKVLAGSWPEAGSLFVLPTPPVWASSLLVLIWFTWAAVSVARTLAALLTLRRAKRAARPFPVAREIRLETWQSLRAGGRRAVLGVSDSVRAAAVLGLTSPSIVVAPSALGALNDAELDQIVVHEWAHVQRRDDLARLVQRIIVALAGLHPAVWWIDRQLNLERETACDDWAVNATGSAKGLAVCLTKLAALPGRPADAVLLPAALLSSELTTRVVRLLDRNRNRSTTRTIGAWMLVAPVLGALALVVASVELVVTSPFAPGTPRAAASVGPSTVALARTAASDAAASSPSAVVSTREPSARAVERVRRAGPAREMPGGEALVTHTSSEHGLPPERADAGVGATDEQKRPEIVLGIERPVVEGRLGADLPGISLPAAGAVPPATSAGSGMPAGGQPVASPTLWGAAADAGVTVGRGTQKGAVATAGFFTRLSKSITGIF